MKVLKITDNPDGSATLDCEITNTEKDLMKRIYNRKRFTSALLGRALEDAITMAERRNILKSGSYITKDEYAKKMRKI